jgi:hypothetical protein
VIQVFVHLKEGQARETKDLLASELTRVVTELVPGEEPVEVWFLEFETGRAYVGGKAV